MMEGWIWNTEPPEASGYYLVTWAYGGDRRSRRVSEMWFDGSNWWTSRTYIDLQNDMGRELTDWVIAWTHKPKPMRGDSREVEL